MSDQKLSELIGLRGEETRREAFWPLTVVMIALGVTVLALAFIHLNPSDPRWSYNPWTYALVTPVVLLLMSIVFSTIANRIIERSLQIAFLLSVMIHLLMMAYAVNVWLPSRMWPDLFDTLAEERRVMEQRQVAPKYHNISATRSAQRPDYLRYVPTAHAATELPESNAASLQMAASQRTELPTPRPEIEHSLTPHVLEREQRQLTTPEASSQPASLSRSELAQKLRVENIIQKYDAPLDTTTPPTLKATETPAERKPNESISLQNQLAPKLNMEPDIASSLSRAEQKIQPELPQPLAPQAVQRTRRDTSQPRRGNQISVPEVAAAQSEANQRLPQNAAAVAKSRNSRTEAKLELPNPNLKEPAQASQALLKREMSERKMQLPKPSAGDAPSALARDSAGGRPGASAPQSLPVVGPEELGSSNPSEPNLLSSMSSLSNRGSRPDRSLAKLPEPGIPQSTDWNQQQMPLSGATGTTPSLAQRAEANGQAMAADVAGLQGAGRQVQRSEVGLAATSGTIALPKGSPGVGEVNEIGELETSHKVAANSAGTAKQTSDGRSGTASEVALQNQSLGINSGVPEGMARAVIQNTPDNSTSITSSSGAPQTKQRETLTGPTATRVEAPAGDEQYYDSSPGDAVAAHAPTRTKPGTIAGQLPLEINADMGLGGLSPEPFIKGPLLPRDVVTPDETVVAELEAQRFTRQAVGGPLAGGRSVPIPTPAFEQRLERLKQNPAIDDGVTGPQTELAIERGLAFLAKHQNKAGCWRLQDFDTQVLLRSDTAGTGLSLLAYQGAGYTHQQFQYAETIEKGLEFLLAHQQKNGDLYVPQDKTSDRNAWLYSHAIATLALCEAYGMTQDPALREPAQRALNFMVESQDKEHGGWRYRPGIATDTSVSGWFMMAFKSGQLAGLKVEQSTFDRIEKYLTDAQVSSEQPYLYRYNPYALDTEEQRHGKLPTPVMTSVGLLMRLYFGWRREQEEMIKGSDYILQNPPSLGSRLETRRDTYYWYYATQVMFHMGGDTWKTWNGKLHPILIKTQVTEGEMLGSWDPYQPTPDLWAKFGGRLYVTTMNLLSLEVNYRHLPLYDATAK